MIEVKDNKISGTTDELLKLRDQINFLLRESKKEIEWPYLGHNNIIEIKIINSDLQRNYT